MKTDMSKMNEKIEKLKDFNCLLLHGIAENEGENTDDLVLKTVNEKRALSYLAQIQIGLIVLIGKKSQIGREEQ